MSTPYTFVQFVHHAAEITMLVAYDPATATPVAVQFTDRNHDPRTGKGFRKLEPLDTSAFVRVSPAYLLWRMDGARVDTDVYQDKWRAEQMSQQVDSARHALVHWMHHEEHKIDSTPVWALVTKDEPHRPNLPVAPAKPTTKVVKRKAKVTPVLQVE